MGHRLEFGVLELGAWSLEFGVWSLEFLYGRGRLIPHADVYRVIHRRSDTTNIGRSFRLYTETWWVFFNILDVALQTLMLCTESCVQKRFCGKVIPLKLQAADVT